MSVYKGGTTLIEADPSSNFEKAVKDFVDQMLGSGRTVFVLTSRGSPVYLLVRQVPGLKLFVFSDVSYPKSSPGSTEVQVPRSDYSVLLNVIDDAINQAPATPKAIILDNISAMILDSSFQDTYKFLKQANELVSRGDVALLSIVLSKAEDAKTMRMIMNLYSQQLAYDSKGLRVNKQT